MVENINDVINAILYNIDKNFKKTLKNKHENNWTKRNRTIKKATILDS